MKKIPTLFRRNPDDMRYVLPEAFTAVEHDPTTGKTVGWEPIEQSAFAKYHTEALVNVEASGDHWAAGTYELVGPKVNGNPERLDRHMLMEHVHAEVFPDVPRDFEGLAKWLADCDGEGIVWHHPDGRMAKLKRRDFPRP